MWVVNVLVLMTFTKCLAATLFVAQCVRFRDSVPFGVLVIQANVEISDLDDRKHR